MKTGLLLLSVFAGAALARGSSSAIHPFVKYKNLASSANTAPAPTSAATPSALECFQVAEPVLTPSGVTRRDRSQLPALASADQIPIEAAADSDSSCSVVLMNRVFENSYGAPYISMR